MGVGVGVAVGAGVGVGVGVGIGEAVGTGVGLGVGTGTVVGTWVEAGWGTGVGVGLVPPQAKPMTANRVMSPTTVTCLTAGSLWFLAVRWANHVTNPVIKSWDYTMGGSPQLLYVIVTLQLFNIKPCLR